MTISIPLISCDHSLYSLPLFTTPRIHSLYSLLSQAVRLLLNDVQGGFNIEYSGRSTPPLSLAISNPLLLHLPHISNPPSCSLSLIFLIQSPQPSFLTTPIPLLLPLLTFLPSESSIYHHYNTPLIPTHPLKHTHTPQTPQI